LPGFSRAAHSASAVFLEADGAPFHRQGIEQQQATGQRFADTGCQFQGFCCLHGADDAGQWGKNAHHRTAYFLDILAFREQAVVARGIVATQVVNADLAIETDGGAGNQRFFVMDAGAVDGVARRKIIGAVQHDVGSRHQLVEGWAGQALLQWDNVDLGIDRA
jgi:hypothetical protein